MFAWSKAIIFAGACRDTQNCHFPRTHIHTPNFSPEFCFSVYERSSNSYIYFATFCLFCHNTIGIPGAPPRHDRAHGCSRDKGRSRGVLSRQAEGVGGGLLEGNQEGKAATYKLEPGRATHTYNRLLLLRSCKCSALRSRAQSSAGWRVTVPSTAVPMILTRQPWKRCHVVFDFE